MSLRQIENAVIDYLISKNPYALVKNAGLGYDEHGFKAWYENADGERNESWLNTYSKEEALQVLKLQQ